MDLQKMKDDWEKDAPRLATLEKKNPYTVTNGYFEEMEAQIYSRIHIGGSNGELSFNVPEGYFEDLADNVMSRIKLEDMKSSGSFEVLNIPDNYFQHLEDSVKTRIGCPEKKVKLRKLAPYSRYVAAACIATIIGIGIYFNQKNQNVEAQISELPADEIVNYLQLYSDAGDASAIMSSFEDGSELLDFDPNLSEKEIKQYLEQSL